MPVTKPVFLTGANLAFTETHETVHEHLTAHARTMEQGIYQLADHFFVAVGYGNANMTMVVGTDGVLIIDSLENAEAAAEALADLRRFSEKPIKALIYTHSHPDHSSGARGVLDPADIDNGSVQIFAHERLFAGMYGNPALGMISPLRLAYSFGWDLDRGGDGWVEVGLGPLLRVGSSGFLAPTQVFSGSLELEIAGIRFHLREAPSESDDEIVVWFPDHGVLHAADVIQGECLANLYALRGAVRDIPQWINAVDMLRQFHAGALIFGHGRPVTGHEDIASLLIAYRDAMQYIHDQAIRLAAQGYTPDELAETLSELPPELRDHAWLGEFYGSVRQIVRQIYVNAFGWFEGDPTFLDSLPRKERSARYLAAMGGRNSVMTIATDAFRNGDPRWTAEILTHLLRVDPEDMDARRLKAEALRQLGYQAANPIWRNNYLMAAREIDGTLDHARLMDTLRSLANPDVIPTVPIALLLRAFVTRLNPDRSAGERLQVALICQDTGDNYRLEVRHRVAEISLDSKAPVMVEIRTTETVLRELLAGRMLWDTVIREQPAALAGGSADLAARFWSFFDPPSRMLPALALR